MCRIHVPMGLYLYTIYGSLVQSLFLIATVWYSNDMYTIVIHHKEYVLPVLVLHENGVWKPQTKQMLFSEILTVRGILFHHWSFVP